MNGIARKIAIEFLGEKPKSIIEIKEFGSVNKVFDITCRSKCFIIRINEQPSKRLEFLKEEWCIDAVNKLGVSVPVITKNGMFEGFPFMIQEKLNGQNGSTCSKEDQLRIWKYLGKVALMFSEIEEIEIAELVESEFHSNWEAKLEYNIAQLNPNDPLLGSKLFTIDEHVEIVNLLQSISGRKFKTGLIHGDMSPRNVMLDKNEMHLLDWGTAEINIIPHSVIGIVQIEGEADNEELLWFLEGMGISKEEYGILLLDIKILNILHRLDKYRWAITFDIENLTRYESKLRSVYMSTKN